MKMMKTKSRKTEWREINNKLSFALKIKKTFNPLLRFLSLSMHSERNGQKMKNEQSGERQREKEATQAFIVVNK
jgi:hypothetical protein